jgi:YHS domain-containing protein
MKKMMIMVILALVLGVFGVGVASAAPPPTDLLERRGLLEGGGKQIACPVQGGKINKEIYTDYQGQRIYFCCPACIDIFKKDPEKHLKKMEREGVVPENIPGGN